MEFLKRHFINESTLGMLKGLDPEMDSELDFENYSPIKKIGVFFLTSTIRFIAELIWITIGSAVIALIDVLGRYFPNKGTEEFTSLANEFFEVTGVEMSWWIFGLISFCAWFIIMSVFYLFWRLIVNIISVTYLSIKKS